MKTIWLVSGRGLQFFCFSRDDVGAALGKICGLIEAGGDSVLNEQDLDALDTMLQRFNDPKAWVDQRTYWHHHYAEVGSPIIMIEAWVIQPRAFAKAICDVGHAWLES